MYKWRLISFDKKQNSRAFLSREATIYHGIRRRQLRWEILDKHGYVVSQLKGHLIDNCYPPYQIQTKLHSINYHLQDLFGSTNEFLRMNKINRKTFSDAVDKLDSKMDSIPFSPAETKFLMALQFLAGFEHWELGVAKNLKELEHI
jgi:hypothetical protein